MVIKMSNGKGLRPQDLGAYAEMFTNFVGQYLEENDYENVTRHLITWYPEDKDVISNQRLTHDFACNYLAPLLAVAVAQKPFLDEMKPGAPEYNAINGMYSWIVQTVQKYCKKYGLVYAELLAEVKKQAPLGDGGFTSPGYHIVSYRPETGPKRWQAWGVDVLAGAFFSSRSKTDFADCQNRGVYNVSL